MPVSIELKVGEGVEKDDAVIIGKDGLIYKVREVSEMVTHKDHKENKKEGKHKMPGGKMMSDKEMQAMMGDGGKGKSKKAGKKGKKKVAKKGY